jgi:hypothetical protein
VTELGRSEYERFLRDVRAASKLLRGVKLLVAANPSVMRELERHFRHRERFPHLYRQFYPKRFRK